MPTDELIVEPYIQRSGREFYNPLTGLTLDVASPAGQQLARWMQGESEDRGKLAGARWLVPVSSAGPERYRLRFASIETFSLCNQRCAFCPVSMAPRPRDAMTQRDFEVIVDQLVPYAGTLEAVFLNFYNEPTIDPLFIERVQALAHRRIPVALLTNGTGLTASHCEALCHIGGLAFLSVNLSTMDKGVYRKTRERDHLTVVLRNLETAARPPIASDMRVNVLGDGGPDHKAQHEAITRFAEPLGYAVEFHVANACCMTTARPAGTLGGCEQTRSRPFNHIQIEADGNCVLCCQDYFGRHSLGNVHEVGIHGVMSGPIIQDLRRQIHGHQPAQENLLCLKCDFALTRGSP